LIIVRSIIAYGAPHKQNTHGAHGAPLGEDEIRLAKAAYGWPQDAKFLVPDEVRAHFAAGIGARGQKLREAWDQRFAEYKKQYPELANEIETDGPARASRRLGCRDQALFGRCQRNGQPGLVGQGAQPGAQKIPWLMGGSADLAPSTNTLLNFAEVGSFEAGNPGGRNLHFGIREHAMGAAAAGMALCGLRPYTATFFVFSDYMRPAMRLAAIMELPILYIFTHDSIGVGEDGPTHQPIEQLAAVRAIRG